MSPARRRRAVMSLLVLTGLAAASGGCSVLPFRSSPAGPDPSAPPDSTAEGTGQDSGMAADADTDAVPDSTVVAVSEVPSPAEPAPPPAPDPDASDQVTVQISDTERAELEARARESLREARRVLRTIDRTTLSAERLEKLAAAETLMDQARTALDGDVRAAATLAHKASVLVAELTVN